MRESWVYSSWWYGCLFGCRKKYQVVYFHFHQLFCFHSFPSPLSPTWFAVFVCYFLPSYLQSHLYHHLCRLRPGRVFFTGFVQVTLFNIWSQLRSAIGSDSMWFQIRLLRLQFQFLIWIQQKNGVIWHLVLLLHPWSIDTGGRGGREGDQSSSKEERERETSSRAHTQTHTTNISLFLSLSSLLPSFLTSLLPFKGDLSVWVREWCRHTLLSERFSPCTALSLSLSSHTHTLVGYSQFWFGRVAC